MQTAQIIPIHASRPNLTHKQQEFYVGQKVSYQCKADGTRCEGTIRSMSLKKNTGYPSLIMVEDQSGEPHWFCPAILQALTVNIRKSESHD